MLLCHMILVAILSISLKAVYGEILKMHLKMMIFSQDKKTKINKQKGSRTNKCRSTVAVLVD